MMDHISKMVEPFITVVVLSNGSSPVFIIQTSLLHLIVESS